MPTLIINSSSDSAAVQGVEEKREQEEKGGLRDGQNWRGETCKDSEGRKGEGEGDSGHPTIPAKGGSGTGLIDFTSYDWAAHIVVNS